MNIDKIRPHMDELNQWNVIDNHHLTKIFTFANFIETLEFVNQVGHLAEEQNHHPDICFGWGRAEITIWTHSVDGVTENDLILAAKIDVL